MISANQDSRTHQTTKVLLLLLVVGLAGCGLGDHGASSGGTGGGGGGGGGATGGSIGSFDDPDDATPVAGAASLPANGGDDFCSTDSLAGISEAGVRGFDFDAGDMIPLCSGWVIVANQTNERIEVRNIVTGAVDSVYDVPGVPEALDLDLDLKYVYVTLPGENLVAAVKLLSSEVWTGAVNSTPTSITQTPGEFLVAADAGTELRAYGKPNLEFLSLSEDLKGEAIVFNSDSDDVIAVSSSNVTIFDYAIAGDNISLTETNDDPTQGETLALKLSPNNDRLVIVNPDGNASFAGPNVINDLDSPTAEITLGTWKVEAGPTSAAFSPLNGVDSDYLLASTATDLVVFDIARHAEISRSTPSTSCSEGSFDQVEFSRGGQIALAKRNCGGTRGTEFHWMAPAAGFGDSLSEIGVDVVGLAAVLPTAEVDPLCTADDLSALTAASSGSLTIPQGADIEPLCDGWVFIAERATNRVVLKNVITGTTLSEWDMTDLPTEMVVDEVNKFLFVTLPVGSGVARIDLAGPNRGDLDTAFTPGSPTSITVGSGNVVYVTAFVEPGELRIRRVDAITMVPSALFPLEVVFDGNGTQIAFDQTTDRLFVSDASGFARFTFNGASFDLVDPEEELFDTLDSEIVAASPDMVSIALVDQTADLVYDFDAGGAIGDLSDTFWEVDSLNEMTAIAFDAMSTVFGVATTNELILFNANGDHAELGTFAPANCDADLDAVAGISRGASVGFYKTDCGGVGSLTETIYWDEF